MAKFKNYYSFSLDEAKRKIKNHENYQKDYNIAYEKVKKDEKSGSSIFVSPNETAQKIFKILMDMGWTKQEIHQYK